MAKIIIFSADSDSRPSTNLAAKLSALGHSVTENVHTKIHPGEKWGEWLLEYVRGADAFVILLTERSMEQKGFQFQIETLKQYAFSKKKPIIPVMLEDFTLPYMLVEIKSISAESLNSEEIAQEVHRTVSSYLIQKTIEEEDNQNKRDQVKRSAATYIQEAINNLEQKASKSSIASMIWFVISAITLMSSTWFIYGLSKDYLPVIANLNKLDSNLIIFISLKSLIIISLCATTSRLTFKLGTVYRAEQLKNLDRIHAISYGKFYLEAFGDQANWVELKEVFQHWNIGNDISTFSLQKSEKSIDIIENLLLEIRAFLSKNLTKK